VATILLTAEQCAEDIVVGSNVGVRFNSIESNSSSIYTQDPCCPECTAPVIVSDLYAGDTLVPYSLNMKDGVLVSFAGDTATTYNGKGLITLTTALVEGQSVVITAAEVNCSTVSSSYTVKAIAEDCDCSVQTPCSIRILDIQYTVEGSEARISYLSVASTGALKYRIDSSEWLSDWTLLNIFSLGDEHSLEIKRANSPR
jgi:hypothetical protein